MVGSRGFEPRSARSERAASADCATSRRCGDHGRIRTATGQALDLLPLPGWATWPLVPPGGLEPPPHGLRTRRAALTLRRGTGADPGDRTRTSAIPGPQAAVTSDQRWSEWRDSNPHLKAWKARRQPLPHIRPGSAWWYQSLIPRPNTDRWRSPAQELLSVVKDPARSSWWAARDSNPIAPWENGFTARQRTIRSYRPFEDKTSPWPGGRSSPHVRPKQKRPSRGSPQKACFSMNAGPLGCFPLRIEHAAVGAIDPDRCHGSAHTGGDARGAGQIEWPS